jgi:hypothetical protein
MLKKKLLFTAKPLRTQRKPLLFNPVRGGIEQNIPGLWPIFSQMVAKAFSFLFSQQKGKIIPPLRSLWLCGENSF